MTETDFNTEEYYTALGFYKVICNVYGEDYHPLWYDEFTKAVRAAGRWIESGVNSVTVYHNGREVVYMKRSYYYD